MELLMVLAGILLLVFLIIKKINPMLALLVVSIVTGFLLNMPAHRIMESIQKGIGDTMRSILMVLALGAMLGRLAELSGAAQKIVQVLTRWFGIRHIQWAVLCTGLLAGIPLFYNAGFVILIPIVFALAASTGLPLLYVGIPMAASLSVTHGFLPPHPGPVALTGVFNAHVGTTMLYGLILAVPTAIIAGVVFPRMLGRISSAPDKEVFFASKVEEGLPSGPTSFLIVLVPVGIIAAGTIGSMVAVNGTREFFLLISDPTFALLIALGITILALRWPVARAMEACIDGVKSIAVIILVIAAGGAFKQVLVDSNVGNIIHESTIHWHLSPLFMGWMVAAVFRIALGSATVAALTTAGIVAPFLASGVSPELMVLAVGAGSLMCSHVNDTGFWMFKEYFRLSLKQTFLTWTIMESIISVLGLIGVLLMEMVVGKGS
jgi:gluconate transporter